MNSPSTDTANYPTMSEGPAYTPRILVVGTTDDYIQWIREQLPGRGVFLVDKGGRKNGGGVWGACDDEIASSLLDSEKVWRDVTHYLDTSQVTVEGVVCFDCEYLALASVIARKLDLRAPSLDAIIRCRSKYASKIEWQRHHVGCPDCRHVHFLSEAKAFFQQATSPCVLKPLTGSGSELVFVCNDLTALEKNWGIMENGLAFRAHTPMYKNGDMAGAVIETFAQGDEYSCDFIIENGMVKILRLSRKIPYPIGPFGTTWAYMLLAPGRFPLAPDRLNRKLADAARALGLERAICMADFIVREETIRFLEMTPRPGGDCLPHLLRTVRGFDMLKFAMDFSCGKHEPSYPGLDENGVTGVRIFANKSGVLSHIDTRLLTDDDRVLDIYFKHTPGHEIRMPPLDYDSWILGHVVFRPDPALDVVDQLNDICGRVSMEIRS